MPKINDNVTMKGDIHIVVKDEMGNITQEYKYLNLVVTTGKNHMAGRLANTTTDGAAITHMAIGTGSTAPIVADSALKLPFGARQTVVLSHIAGTNYMTAVANFPGTTYATIGICEAGLFTDSTIGLLVCRTTFSPFTISSAEIIGISWKITII